MRAIHVILVISMAITMTACSDDDPVNPGNGNNDPTVLFSDDFEGDPCLDKWVVGGRQAEGTNTADCVIRGDSKRGHLFKSSFTEINLVPNPAPFDFVAGLTFKVDLEVRVSSSGPVPNTQYYGMAEMRFMFRNANGDIIGHVRYAAATTSLPFDDDGADPTRAAIALTPGVSTSHSLTVEDMLSHITIDENEIATVDMKFNTYSSTRPQPSVEAELWIDNFQVEKPAK